MLRTDWAESVELRDDGMGSGLVQSPLEGAFDSLPFRFFDAGPKGTGDGRHEAEGANGWRSVRNAPECFHRVQMATLQMLNRARHRPVLCMHNARSGFLYGIILVTIATTAGYRRGK